MLRIIETTCTDEASATLRLALDVVDPLVVDYLRPFEDHERAQKALEALKVGVIALRSVTPSLDTSLVEQKFGQLERSLQRYAETFAAGLTEQMDRYFKDDTGALPRKLDSLIGVDGSMPKALEDYFHGERGRLITIMRSEIGPQSDFGKMIDPDNSRGLLQRIESAIAAKLAETAQGVLDEFSLDHDGSVMTRLQALVCNQIADVRKENASFFAELKEHFGIERGRQEEALKGTQKGRDFETSVYERLAPVCARVGDVSENLASFPGSISRCKTGDFVITLGDESGAPGTRIVIEAKNRDGFTLRTALEELKEAKENREASVGVMVFETACCPVEVGGFRIVGNDILVRASIADSAETDVFLESAYRVARALAVAHKRARFNSELDVQRIVAAVSCIQAACERFAEIYKKAGSIKQSATAIEEIADDMRPEIQQALRDIELVTRVDPATG